MPSPSKKKTSETPSTRGTSQTAAGRLLSRVRSQNLEDHYPLTPMQHGMLLHSLCDPRPGIFLVQSCFELPEVFDAGILRAACKKAVQRHPMLRASLNWDDYDEPQLEVHRNARVSFKTKDWSDLSQDECRQARKQFLSADRLAGFNLREPPLLRVALFQLPAKTSLLVVTFHHTILDTRSLSAVLDEVLGIYEACLRGETPTFPRTTPFSQYVEWLRRLPKNKAANFWRERLRGIAAPTPLLIPDDGEAKEAEHNELELRWPTAKTADLQKFARKHELTSYSVLQCAWGLLLSEYAQCEDVVFGAVRACREEAFPGVERIIGPAINTMPVRLRCGRSVDVLTWLRQSRAEQLEGRAFEQTALTDIHGWSEVPRRLPLFESIMNLGYFPVGNALRARYRGILPKVDMIGETNYALTIKGYHSTELVLKAAYDEKRFSPGAIMHTLEHLLVMLETIVSHPQVDLRTVLALAKEAGVARSDPHARSKDLRSVRRRSVGLSE